MPFTTYSDALTYIYTYISYNPASTARWSLERLRDLLTRLGDPHKSYPALLIAGTKGKGSTAAMCEAITRAAGYQTGLYTSPHLHSFRERIAINGQPIPEALLITLLNKAQPEFEATPDLTIFELITALAFLAFAEAKVDTAIVEVGLGGRLDATNVIDAVVPIITAISYDHMQILGDSLALIAGEKAGIIRPNALVVSSPQFDEARQVIEQVCIDRQAELVQVEKAYPWHIIETSLKGQTFRIDETDYRLALLGEHQVTNAVTSIAAIKALTKRSGLPISTEAIQTGLAQVVWRGRMEILHQQPYLVLDSAMNGHSAEQLVLTLKSYFPDNPLTLIYGASNDHPVDDMLAALAPVSDRLIMTASRHPRAEKPERLVTAAQAAGYQATAIADAFTAFEQTWAQATEHDLICVTGSLFLVADVREAWLRQQGLPIPPIDPMIEIRK